MERQSEYNGKTGKAVNYVLPDDAARIEFAKKYLNKTLLEHYKKRLLYINSVESHVNSYLQSTLKEPTVTMALIDNYRQGADMTPEQLTACQILKNCQNDLYGNILTIWNEILAVRDMYCYTTTIEHTINNFKILHDEVKNAGDSENRKLGDALDKADQEYEKALFQQQVNSDAKLRRVFLKQQSEQKKYLDCMERYVNSYLQEEFKEPTITMKLTATYTKTKTVMTPQQFEAYQSLKNNSSNRYQDITRIHNAITVARNKMSYSTKTVKEIKQIFETIADKFETGFFGNSKLREAIYDAGKDYNQGIIHEFVLDGKFYTF